MAAGERVAAKRVAECLDAVDRLEPTVGAWEHLGREQAVATANELDLSSSRLPLHGLVAAVKDIFDTADMPTCCGSPLYAGRRPSIDAAVVSLLRGAGAVVLGKTVTTEFACSKPSRTRNPVDLRFTPGGSSSGSAAAVAAGMASIALGTQTLGSIIRPASFCGVVGFKPSFGRISRAGVFSLCPTLDTVGLFGANVPDVRRTFDALMGSSYDDVTPNEGRRLRLGVATGSLWDQASDDAKAAHDAFIDHLSEIGHSVEPVEFSAEFVAVAQAARVVHDFEVGQRFIAERRSNAEVLSTHIHAILDRADAIDIRNYEAALVLGETSREKYSRLLKDWDALITLAAPGESPFGFASTGDPVFNTAWTFLHVPCVSLPRLRGRNRMPIGIQLVGPRFADAALLDAAELIEQQTPVFAPTDIVAASVA